MHPGKTKTKTKHILRVILIFSERLIKIIENSSSKKKIISMVTIHNGGCIKYDIFLSDNSSKTICHNKIKLGHNNHNILFYNLSEK